MLRRAQLNQWFPWKVSNKLLISLQTVFLITAYTCIHNGWKQLSPPQLWHHHDTTGLEYYVWIWQEEHLHKDLGRPVHPIKDEWCTPWTLGPVKWLLWDGLRGAPHPCGHTTGQGPTLCASLSAPFCPSPLLLCRISVHVTWRTPPGGTREVPAPGGCSPLLQNLPCL